MQPHPSELHKKTRNPNWIPRFFFYSGSLQLGKHSCTGLKLIGHCLGLRLDLVRIRQPLEGRQIVQQFIRLR